MLSKASFHIPTIEGKDNQLETLFANTRVSKWTKLK